MYVLTLLMSCALAAVVEPQNGLESGCPFSTEDRFKLLVAPVIGSIMNTVLSLRSHLFTPAPWWAQLLLFAVLYFQYTAHIILQEIDDPLLRSYSIVIFSGLVAMWNWSLSLDRSESFMVHFLANAFIFNALQVRLLREQYQWITIFIFMFFPAIFAQYFAPSVLATF